MRMSHTRMPSRVWPRSMKRRRIWIWRRSSPVHWLGPTPRGAIHAISARSRQLRLLPSVETSTANGLATELAEQLRVDEERASVLAARAKITEELASVGAADTSAADAAE